MSNNNQSSFSKYLTTLIIEKGKDPSADLNIEGHIGLSYNHLIEFIDNLKDTNIKDNIKNNLVKIDFKNGNVFHFLDYLVDAMVKSNF